MQIEICKIAEFLRARATQLPGFRAGYYCETLKIEAYPAALIFVAQMDKTSGKAF